MCGICGWIARRPGASEVDRATVMQMNTTLTHRGPDDSGVEVFENAALAMSRLSIIDRLTGNQPAANDTKTCWIVYNGEIYNFLPLRRDLEARGYRFHTRSDTEVVLHAYEEWGPDCVHHLRGMFALAIYDRRPLTSNHQSEPLTAPGRLILARDRVGKKPLYYYYNTDTFLFASEIKALLAHPEVPRQVNRQVIPLYLAYGYAPAPFTMFKDIHELPPGHTLIVQDGQISTHNYWDIGALPRPSHSLQLSEQDWSHQLRDLLEEAVALRLNSDVPLGVLLSGGLDSTAVVAFMARHMDQPIKTFAIGFTDDPSFNELEYARLAARTYETDHHEFIVPSDTAVELIQTLVWHYDQPFADSSALPTYLVSKLSREHVTVALTGDGGDELFAGYERFAAVRLAEVYRRTPQFIQAALAYLLRAWPEPTSYNSFVRRARLFLEHAPLPLAQRYLGWVGIFRDSFIRKLLADTIAIDPLDHFRSYFDQAEHADPIEQLLAVNAKTYLPGDLLVKTDRMSMANSLEIRCPFLDHKLFEFAACIPVNLKLRGLTTKYILKKALDGLVPPAIMHRKKHGFGVPVGRWFRTSLKEYVCEVLLSPRALRRGYFQKVALQQLIAEHHNGKRDHGHKLWALLTFELWHRIFIDRENVS
jgi:asparagine synthase (glutamine-hydrolysing)